MLVGPIFGRELVVAPRRTRMYVGRATYVLVLLILMSTAWLVLTGTQHVRDLGDLARFGMLLFQILAPLQAVLAVCSSALLAASAVAQQKDRRTLELLLVTNLTNSELVLGTVLASLLEVGVLLAASVVFFLLLTLFGGIAVEQIGRVLAVTVAGSLLAGSVGAMLAFWREKTYQALAMTVLVLVLWLGLWEVVGSGVLVDRWWGISCQSWAASFSPWRAVLEASRPYLEPDPALGILRTPVHVFLIVSVLLAAGINGVAVAGVRIWNPAREAQTVPEEDRPRPGLPSTLAPGQATNPRRAGAPARSVWDNPILWREVCTRAYGRRMLLIRLAYLVIFFLATAILYRLATGDTPMTLTSGASVLVPLLLLGLVLVNAQAVTSLTSERDSGALDLLLVSDITPVEFVGGKLAGALYNTKEMVVLPLALCLGLGVAGVISLEHAFYLAIGLAVLYGFVVMLGVHAGMNYANSRGAIAASLGTVFFLFVGVAVCMRVMLAFSGSFQAQWPPFFACMVGGGAGLYLALGVRNPSTAIGLASFLCPLATFYAITTLFIEQIHLVFVAITGAYGFAILAMLIPAIYEFDLATGRTTLED